MVATIEAQNTETFFYEPKNKYPGHIQNCYQHSGLEAVVILQFNSMALF